MYAAGHMAIGYLLARIQNRDNTLNIPIIWALSILPDIDLLIPNLEHRGPTHSLIFSLIIFLPLIIHKKGKIIPYYTALLSHSVIDLFTNNGTQFLWPISDNNFRFPYTLKMGTTSEGIIEIILFAIMILIIILYKDYNKLIQYTNNLMITSIFLIFIASISIKYAYSTPKILLIPHITLVGIIFVSFIASISKKLINIFKKE